MTKLSPQSTMRLMDEINSYGGFFITLEGPEGSGKSTQTLLLVDHLEKLGLSVVASREPGGTDIGDEVRDIVHDVRYSGTIDHRTEVFLYQASRAQHVSEKLIPMLNEGYIMVVDRFGDSSKAYQGEGRGFGPDLIQRFNDFSTQGLTPDLTLLLDIDVEEGLSRREDSGVLNRMDMQEIEFHQKTRDAYLEFLKTDETGRWVKIDGSRSILEVRANIREVVERRLIQRGLLEGNRSFGPERG